MTVGEPGGPYQNHFICSHCEQDVKLSDVMKIEVVPGTNHIIITRTCPCFATLKGPHGGPPLSGRTMYRWNLFALNHLFEGKPFTLPWERPQGGVVDVEQELTQWAQAIEHTSDSDDFLAQLKGWSVHDDRVRQEFRKKWETEHGE